MKALAWLLPGRDRELAAERYAHCESASDRAARLRREKHHRTGATRADRKAQSWLAAQR